MGNRAVFFPDDIDRMNAKYFNAIRDSGDVNADPSYWYENESNVAFSYGLEAVRAYHSDYGGGLRDTKPTIVSAISEWDAQSYDSDDLSLCSSATTGSLAVLSYLRYFVGIDEIIFETPCYFASLKQANYLGYKVTMAPTYSDTSFNMDRSYASGKQAKVIWTTQPRFGLGANYDLDHLNDILARMGAKDVLVMDEATEQLRPSHLHRYNHANDRRIIKIRSPFKGMGINGPRISTILHGRDRRAGMQLAREQVQGSIDVFSLRFAVEFLSDHDRFFAMLAAANRQVVELNHKLEARSQGTRVTPSRMQNGYIGSVAVAYDRTDRPYVRNREDLLRHCANHRMPVILGANLNFATDVRQEFIRMSYFGKERDLLEAVKILSLFTVSDR